VPGLVISNGIMLSGLACDFMIIPAIIFPPMDLRVISTFTTHSFQEAQRSPTSLKREQSLATLQSLRVKTQQAREQADAKQRANPLFVAHFQFH
jgi:hypothetical protein